MRKPFGGYVALFLVGTLWGLVAEAQEAERGARSYPPQLPGATAEVYKVVGDVQLQIYRYSPQDAKPGHGRPAIVFFFGGGWRSGTPAQFQQHCEHLAERGMVALTADYRVSSRHQVHAVDCVRDAKSAIRWVRQNAQRLGIDPDRIAAGGGSAGGHLAAACGVVKEFDEPTEDLSVSSRPNALVLFNPALALTSLVERPAGKGQGAGDLRQRLGVEPREISPLEHVASGTPPTLILHGKADTTVPYRTAELFTEAMHAAGNRCELAGYEGQQHGFFNYGRSGNEYYRQTVQKMDEFLESLGYLQAQAK